MDTELLSLATGGRWTTDITAAAADYCRGRGDGLLAGVMQLGTWQSIDFVDPNVDNPRRQVRLSFLAG